MTESGCFTVFTVNLLWNLLEPMGLLTLDLVALMQRKVDSSEYMTVDQAAAVQCWYCLQNASLFLFIFSVKRGLRAATLLGIFSCFWRANWTLRSAERGPAPGPFASADQLSCQDIS